MPYTSEYEEAGRALKATRLAEAFVTWATTANDGVEPDVATVAAVAQHAAPELWADVAALADVRKPSDRTIAVVCAILARRSRRPEPADPFDGLPS